MEFEVHVAKLSLQKVLSYVSSFSRNGLKVLDLYSILRVSCWEIVITKKYFIVAFLVFYSGDLLAYL